MFKNKSIDKFCKEEGLSMRVEFNVHTSKIRALCDIQD